MSSMRLTGLRAAYLLSLAILILTGCAPSGLYYWGDYENSLFERYVENNPQHNDAYLTQTLIEAERQHRRVPPGVYADYGFLLYRRGDKAGAIENFKKERALYPESSALMNKLIEKIQQKENTPDASHKTSLEPSVEGQQK
jgi:hypothetical protein